MIKRIIISKPKINVDKLSEKELKELVVKLSEKLK